MKCKLAEATLTLVLLLESLFECSSDSLASNHDELGYVLGLQGV